MAGYSRRSLLTAGVASGLALATAGAARAGDRPRAKAFGVGDVAYVDVAVATLWVAAETAREVDAPSLANPVDLRAWTAAMSLAERRWLIGDLETAALYGKDVLVTEESGDWVKIVVPGQPTPRDERGYPGWVPRIQLTDTAPDGADGPFAQVIAPTSWLHDDAGLGKQFMELSYGNRLPVADSTETAVRVATSSHGEKWLAASDVTVYDSADSIPAPTGEDLVAAAKLFLGLPYLWAGVSGFGFDCSGLTHSVYNAHGVVIPRDAGPQLDAGEPVSEQDLQAGDLLFYGVDRIHHVGMYVGDGDMIDARTNTDTTEQLIEIVPVAEHPYADEFAGAVRYL
ncbi:MAG: NlpC/P60 family protein [Stackebrandtia sp.]